MFARSARVTTFSLMRVDADSTAPSRETARTVMATATTASTATAVPILTAIGRSPNQAFRPGAGGRACAVMMVLLGITGPGGRGFVRPNGPIASVHWCAVFDQKARHARILIG